MLLSTDSSFLSSAIYASCKVPLGRFPAVDCEPRQPTITKRSVARRIGRHGRYTVSGVGTRLNKEYVEHVHIRNKGVVTPELVGTQQANRREIFVENFVASFACAV